MTTTTRTSGPTPAQTVQRGVFECEGGWNKTTRETFLQRYMSSVDSLPLNTRWRNSHCKPGFYSSENCVFQTLRNLYVSPSRGTHKLYVLITRISLVLSLPLSLSSFILVDSFYYKSSWIFSVDFLSLLPSLDTPFTLLAITSQVLRFPFVWLFPLLSINIFYDII